MEKDCKECLEKLINCIDNKVIEFKNKEISKKWLVIYGLTVILIPVVKFFLGYKDNFDLWGIIIFMGAIPYFYRCIFEQFKLNRIDTIFIILKFIFILLMIFIEVSRKNIYILLYIIHAIFIIVLFDIYINKPPKLLKSNFISEYKKYIYLENIDDLDEEKILEIKEKYLEEKNLKIKLENEIINLESKIFINTSIVITIISIIISMISIFDNLNKIKINIIIFIILMFILFFIILMLNLAEKNKYTKTLKFIEKLEK